MGYWSAGERRRTGVRRPNEDFDKRDHRDLRCGADRPAIIQTGTECVQLEPLGARPSQVREEATRTHSEPSRGRVRRTRPGARGEYVIDGGPSSEVPQDSSQPEDLPDRLRVHSLARVLGTTSRQVLDALTELDGRIRSAHSTVDRVDAVRVRDLLASAPATVAAPVVATEAGAEVEADEPESRLLLETAVERPEYMPLFVAPQPVKRNVGQDDTDASEDTDESDDSDDSGDDDDFD